MRCVKYELILPCSLFAVSLADTTTLQSLLAAQGHTSQLTTASGETIQIIAVSNQADLTNSKMWQVMPTINSTEFGTIIINQSDEAQDTGKAHLLLGGGEIPNCTVFHLKMHPAKKNCLQYVKAVSFDYAPSHKSNDIFAYQIGFIL